MTRSPVRADRILCRFGLALLLPGLMIAPAASGGPLKADLQHSRTRLQVLRKELDSFRETRNDTLTALKKNDQAISQTNKTLHDLELQQQALSASLARLNAQNATLQRHLTAQKALLGRLLVSEYRSGDQDALRILLNGEDPERVNRNWTYYRYLLTARGRMIGHMRDDLAHLQALQQEEAGQKQSLADNMTQQAQAKARLVTEQDARKQLLAQLSGKITRQRQAIGQEERNEKRLSDLIVRLAQAQKQQAAKARRRRHERQTVHEAPAARGLDATALNGRLGMPVQGTITNRFGAQRPEGTNWKGLFIRAAAGTPVRAVAAGQVVYAGWLRGFGNLLIIDHGNGLMSLYGDNAALDKKTGDQVRAGETIATVGNSGDNPQTGLYYEIRLRGQPVDPLLYSARGR